MQNRQNSYNKILSEVLNLLMTVMCISTGFIFEAFAEKRAITTENKAKVIGHWNVVPHQTVSGEFQVGVVAFHMNGVARVALSVAGNYREPFEVTDVRYNPRTGTYEYWAPLNKIVGDKTGNVEINASIYPKGDGVVRSLKSLNLVISKNGVPSKTIWVSSSGSDEKGNGSKSMPFRQPAQALQYYQKQYGDAGDLKIMMGSGEYTWGPRVFAAVQTSNQWVTIQGAPEVLKENIVFVDSKGSGFGVRLLHIKNMTIKGLFLSPGKKNSKLWIENSIVTGLGAESGKVPYYSSNWSEIFLTNSLIQKFRDGAVGATLVRNVQVKDIGSDAFSGSRLVINSEVDGIDRGAQNYHPDVFQIYCGGKEKENYILYGVRAVNANAQGIFTGGCETLNNVAIVNVLIAKPFHKNPDKPYFSQWTTNGNHIIISGLSLLNSAFIWRAESVQNAILRESLLYSFATYPMKGKAKPSLKTNLIQDLHIIKHKVSDILHSQNRITYGLVDSSNVRELQYHPLKKPILTYRVENPFSKIDVYGNLRGSPSSIGAVE